MRWKRAAAVGLACAAAVGLFGLASQGGGAGGAGTEALLPNMIGQQVKVYLSHEATGTKAGVFVDQMNGLQVSVYGELIGVDDDWVRLRMRGHTAAGQQSVFDSVLLNRELVYAIRVQER